MLIYFITGCLARLQDGHVVLSRGLASGAAPLVDSKSYESKADHAADGGANDGASGGLVRSGLNGGDLVEAGALPVLAFGLPAVLGFGPLKSTVGVGFGHALRVVHVVHNNGGVLVSFGGVAHEISAVRRDVAVGAGAGRALVGNGDLGGAHKVRHNGVRLVGLVFVGVGGDNLGAVWQLGEGVLEGRSGVIRGDLVGCEGLLGTSIVGLGTGAGFGKAAVATTGWKGYGLGVGHTVRNLVGLGLVSSGGDGVRSCVGVGSLVVGDGDVLLGDLVDGVVSGGGNVLLRDFVGGGVLGSGHVVLRDGVGGDNVVGGDVLGSNFVGGNNVVGGNVLLRDFVGGGVLGSGHMVLRDGVVGDNVVGGDVLLGDFVNGVVGGGSHVVLRDLVDGGVLGSGHVLLGDFVGGDNVVGGDVLLRDGVVSVVGGGSHVVLRDGA